MRVLLTAVLLVLAAVPLLAKPALYDVDASGADVRSVLEALAQRSGVSIVVGPEITGPLTAHLRQLPIDAILDNISVCQGFAWQRSGTAYLVGPKERLNPPQPEAEPAASPSVLPPPPPPEKETLVWSCKHVRPADLTATVTKLFPSIAVAEGPNKVTPELPKSQGMGGESSGGSASAESSGPKSNSTTVVLIGDPADIAKARELMTKLDVARAQVSIQVAITEINSSANKELGINWTWNDLVLTETPRDSGIAFGKFAKEGMTFTGAISALGTKGSANLLAQPNISVVDGESADILIGDRILFPKLVGYTQFGTPIYDKEEERVGIYLQIAPRVTGDDEIVMTVYPQVSLVTKYLKTQAGDYPQISTREARTTVSVKNGATLAIGGLLRDDEIREGSKIPLLGDIPILGQLFRHTKKTKQRTEIVIFLTPKIQKINGS